MYAITQSLSYKEKKKDVLYSGDSAFACSQKKEGYISLCCTKGLISNLTN